jgi:uncharacterized protein (DUF1330 family)
MMRRLLLPTLTMVAGMAIGGVAVQGLHAQARPPIYEIAEIDVTNTDAYLKDYLPRIRAARENGGGKVLAASAGITQLAGSTPPQRVGIVVWESLEQLQAVRASSEFKAARAIGKKYATFREFAVEGSRY